MALDVVGGASVYAIYEKLRLVVFDAIEKAPAFYSILKQLHSTLQSLNPNIQEIERLNSKLDVPEEKTEMLIQIFRNGKKLIQKCYNVSHCNCCKRWWLDQKLRALNASLVRFFQVDMQAQESRNRVVFYQFQYSPLDFLVGLDVPLIELKRRLFKDGGSRTVVSAPGGCGKTTLAKMLCEDHDVKGKFKNIFYVKVGRTPDIIAIIKKLFQLNDHPVPHFTSEEDAVNQLELLLKNKEPGPILLVLDEVWHGSESLLDKFKFQISDYKVLVTSRNEFPGFGFTYKLKLLSDEDAMTLFHHSAFPEDKSCSFMEAQDLVKKIVRRCDGFPLALKEVGCSLHGKPAEIWKDRLIKLSEGESIFSPKPDLRDCLQKSLDVLDHRSILKECFMDLGSFPKDQKIPATALIDIWAELYKLDKRGIHAIANLQKLCSQNLLKRVVTRIDASEMDEFYNDGFVMQHDILRELAIYHSSQESRKERKRLIVELHGNELPAWWTEEKQQPLNASLLSISTDEKFSPSWCNMQMPKLEVLILNFQAKKNYKLPEFMKQMDKLKVMIVTNYGFCGAELVNFSVLGSLSNLKRMRLERVSIPTLSKTAIELKNLEKISLVMCKNIEHTFENGTIQIPEMLPNLMEIDIDYCNDLVRFPEELCDLVRLNKLSITNCHRLSALPEGIGKLTNLQELRTRSCTTLSKLPDSIGSLRKLSLLDISGCIGMRTMPIQIGELCELRELFMRRCPRLRELPPSITDLVDLERVICDEETALLWEAFEDHLPDLRILVPEENINLSWL